MRLLQYSYRVLVSVTFHLVIVGFASKQFSGFEVSEHVEVVVILNNETNFPVLLTITPLVILPVSAMGKFYNSL